MGLFELARTAVGAARKAVDPVFGALSNPALAALGWGSAQLPTQRRLQVDYALQGRIDESAPVVGSATAVIDAPAGDVWRRLVDLHHWSDWSPGVHHVSGPATLAVGSRFGWWNGPLVITSTVAVLVPERELTWTGYSVGAHAVSRHLLHEDGGRTTVTTAESMRGPFVAQLYPSAKLIAGMQDWLTALAAAAGRT